MYQYGFVTALKDVSYASVTPIVGLSVSAVELSHPLREVALGGLDDQVVVVVPQTVSMTKPVKAVNHLCHGVEEQITVLIVMKDVLAGITSGGKVVNSTGILDSERPAHGGPLPGCVLALVEIE